MKFTVLFLLALQSIINPIASGTVVEHKLVHQVSAMDYISLFEKFEGSPGYPIYNWYLTNKSSNRAIKVNVLFSTNSSYNGENQWTQSFELEPGDLKMIGNKTYDGKSYTYAKIVGARFI